MKRRIATCLLLGALSVLSPVHAADPVAPVATAPAAKTGPLDAVPPWFWLCAVGLATGGGMAGGWFARGAGHAKPPDVRFHPSTEVSASQPALPPLHIPTPATLTPGIAPLPARSPAPPAFGRAPTSPFPPGRAPASPFPSGREPISPFPPRGPPEPVQPTPSYASEGTMPLDDPASTERLPAIEATSAPEALPPPRAGHGPHAAVLTRLDQAFGLFKQGVSEPALRERFPEVDHSAAQFNYFHELLLQLSDHGATQYTTSFGDTIEVATFEQWLDLFATTVLDPFSIRCTDLLLAGLDGDGVAQLLGDVYRDLLQYQVAEALREAGYAPVQAFPLSGGAPQPATMRVVGTAGRPALTGQVVGLHQYGLVKGRTLVRQAHVTTG